MDKETFESQKRFAGEKKASMQRRCVGHDYQERHMYMITMVTEGRRPLFGQVEGRSDAPEGSEEAPRLVPTPLGQRVSEEWWAIPTYYPEIEVRAFQLMPDHLHGVLFVREHMEVHLGKVLGGFKTGCNKAFRELVPLVAAQLQQTRRRPDGKDNRSQGLLFARGYNDKLLLRAGQLETWLNYLHDNPRRLLMKREHPDLFRVQRGLQVADATVAAIGNRFLLERPVRLQVQCSRRLDAQQIAERVAFFLKAASEGAVLVSPCISDGEKRVMRAAFEKGYPLIVLKVNGFTELAKPSGRSMEACACGQLLIVAPWEHHNEQIPITRKQCLQLNELARRICAGVAAEQQQT